MRTFDEESLALNLAEHVGKKVINLQVVTGGYTLAKRYIVHFDDGGSVFAKIATNNDTADWLRAEYNFYSQSNHSFHPKMLGWKDEQDETYILLEDLSKAQWSYEWTDSKIKAVFNGLNQISKAKPPADLPLIGNLHSDLFCWHILEENPYIFINSGLAEKSTLKKELIPLRELAKFANIEGKSLVHMDIRSDNTCFIGDQVLFVDWNHACIGNPIIDTLFWLPSLYLEGGPEPWSYKEIQEPELVALILGYFIYNASLEAPHIGSDLRNFQKRQLEVVYKWFKSIA